MTGVRHRGENRAADDNNRVEPVAPRPRPGNEPPALHDGERELVASILRHDRKAAAQFVAAHIDAVYSYARHRLAPRSELVDDVVQDVFLAALKALPGFHGESSLRTWLIGIARHKVEDIYRQRLRVPDSLDDEDAAAGSPLTHEPPFEEQIDAARARIKARQTLARLPERYALVLIWRYWERKSTREIAAAIAATEKSVERLLARARERFKSLWTEE